MSKKNKYLFIMLIALALIFTFDKSVSAEPINIPNVNISVGGESTSPQNYVDNIKLLIILTILTLLPSIIIMMTSFTRIIVVFSIFKKVSIRSTTIYTKSNTYWTSIIFNYIHNATSI